MEVVQESDDYGLNKGCNSEDYEEGTKKVQGVVKFIINVWCLFWVIFIVVGNIGNELKIISSLNKLNMRFSWAYMGIN